MKRLLAFVLTVCLLSGCSLAVGNGQTVPQSDELTGVLLTMARKDGDGLTDLWDAEAAGMECIANETMKGQRLDAVKAEGDTVSWDFPAGCGLGCYSYTVKTQAPESDYRSNTIAPEVDAHLSYHAGDEYSHRFEATIYAEPDTDLILAMNPVYQEPNGQVYTLGTGPVWYDLSTMDGCSEILSAEGCSVTLTICHVALPERYVITEMDEDNVVLRSVEVTPGELPEVYAPGPDAAYLILEAVGETTSRWVHSRDDQGVFLDTYYPGVHGLCIRGYTRIDWEG